MYIIIIVIVNDAISHTCEIETLIIMMIVNDASFMYVRLRHLQLQYWWYTIMMIYNNERLRHDSCKWVMSHNHHYCKWCVIYNNDAIVSQMTRWYKTWHIHVWHDSLICVTWLIYMCDMTHYCKWRTHKWCAVIR